jgi:hypothetical protein
MRLEFVTYATRGLSDVTPAEVRTLFGGEWRKHRKEEP